MERFSPPLQTEIVKLSDLTRAAELLKLGKLVAFPTDTFFALGVAIREEPVKSLFAAKGRMAGNPVPVLLSSSQQLAQVTDGELSPAGSALAAEYWPGPLTIVVSAAPNVPEAVTAGTGSVGVRVPDHDPARELIALSESPLTGTSANLSGMEPCKTAEQVLQQLDGVIDAVVDAPCGPHSDPSTVVRFDAQELQILREGSISEADIRRVTAGADGSRL